MQLKVWTEEEIVDAAYRKAEVVYYIKYHKLNPLGISLDDFKQDAAMHILKKYREGYFFIKEKPDPIVFTFLNNFFVRNIITLEARRANRISKLDEFVGNSKDLKLSNFVDRSQEPNPEDLDREKARFESGKGITLEIINKMDVVPYKTRKHTYLGKDAKLGKIKLSEHNIARLILDGKELHDILTIYGEDRVNSGKSSTSSYISSKIKKTKEKIIEEFYKLTTDEQLDIKTYLSLNK